MASCYLSKMLKGISTNFTCENIKLIRLNNELKIALKVTFVKEVVNLGFQVLEFCMIAAYDLKREKDFSQYLSVKAPCFTKIVILVFSC